MTDETTNTINNGDNVSVHYKGTLKDGSVFDSSYQRGNPISFTIGSGTMIEGFEANVKGMALGEKKKFTIPSDQAYGPHDEQAMQAIPKSSFPADFDFTPGQSVTGSSPNGNTVNAVIVSEEEDSIILDFNHPMAGKDLTFEVEVVSVDSATNEKEDIEDGVETSD